MNETSGRRKQDKFEILDSPRHYGEDFAASTGQLGCAVVFFDLDDFKKLNTRFTEPVIDKTLLLELHHLIDALARNRGFAYAEGGDEFIILLPNTNPDLAEAFADVLLDEIRHKEFDINGASVSVTASAGISWSKDPGDAEACRVSASEAKRDAKEQGKDRHVSSQLASLGERGRRKPLLEIDSSTTYALLQGRLYRHLGVEDVEKDVTITLQCDGADEASIRAVPTRSRVELTFGNHVVRGRLEESRIKHVASQRVATIVISKRDGDQDSGTAHDANWGGSEPLSADEIAKMRASRLLTDKPKAQKAEFGGVEMFIRGSSHSGIEVVKSPIPELIRSGDRDEPSTWERLRLELVRQLILTRCTDRIERLALSVDHGRLVHVSFRGLRQRYPNWEPYIVEVDEPVDF